MQMAGKINGTDKVSHEDLQKLLKEADKDGDGIIELQEFKDAFLTSEEYKNLEEEYLAAFEEIAKLDGKEGSISTEDIADAIEAYDKLDAETETPEAPAPSSGGSSGGGGGGGGSTGGGTTPTGGEDKVGDLSGKELPELKSERSDVLKDIGSLRSEKTQAVSQADTEVTNAQESYDEATKALADIVKEKVEAKETTNEYAQDVMTFEDQKNALQSDISDQKGVVSQATDLVSTISSELSSLVAPPETISYYDETTKQTVSKRNPAYDEYLAEKAALEAELAAAEEDLAAQEEALAVLESDLGDTEALLEQAIVSYAKAEQAEGRLTEEELTAIENISTQSDLYNQAKIAKEEVTAEYDKEMDTLQANLVAYNDAITEKELELPEGYGVEKGEITNGETNLEKIAEEELPEGYKIEGTSIKDEEGNVVGMVTGTEESPQLYLMEKVEAEEIGPAMCYYNARLFFEEAIAAGEDPTESVWGSVDFSDVNSADVKRIEEYYNEMVSEYNSKLENGETPALTFTEEAKARYSEEENKANYEAIVDSIERANNDAKVRPDSFEAYLNKNNVDISSATETEMNEYLDKFMEEKYGELYKEEYYPAITEEQLTEYLGEGGLETLKEADDATINAKIEKILTDENLTPYEQMQMLESIKNYSEEAKAKVDNYFKNDDTYFYQKLDEMVSAQKDDGSYEYSSEDLIEFIKQYKNLDSSSSVLGSDSKINDSNAYMDAILSVYDRTENKDELSELNSYLNASVIADYVQENYEGEEAQAHIQKLFEASIADNLNQDGKLSINPEDYGIKDEDKLANLENTYLKSNGTSSEKVQKIMQDLSTGAIDRSSAQYLVSSILGGDPKNITDIQSTNNSKMVSEVFKLFDSKPYEAFGNGVNLKDPKYIVDGDYHYMLMGPENVDPNQPLPLIVYLGGSGEYKAGEYGTVGTYDRNGNGTIEEHEVKYNSPGTILSGWNLEDFNGYVIAPSLDGVAASEWATKTAEEYVRGIVESFTETHNVNADMIFVGGHSLGGIGAFYMADKADDIFSKAFVLSGYGHGSYNIADIDMPIIGYNGVSDSGFMAHQFVKEFGEDSLVKVKAGHGAVPVNAFQRDADGNGRSDLIEWLLEGKELPTNSDEY